MKMTLRSLLGLVLLISSTSVAAEVEVNVGVQPYELISEVIQPPIFLEPLTIETNKFHATAPAAIAQIVKQSLAKSQPLSNIKVDFEIRNNRLTASTPLRASLQDRFQSVAQSGGIHVELSPGQPIDLDHAFQITASPSSNHPSEDHLTIIIDEPSGFFYADTVVVELNNGNFKFRTHSGTKESQSIALRLKPIRILLKKPTGFHVDSGEREGDAAQLFTNLKREFVKHHEFELSGFTYAELKEKREELREIPVGYGKRQIINQYDVDYIVEVTFTMSN